MARGQKTSPETVYKIMTSWAITNSYSKTANDTGVPIATVKRIILKNKDKEEFKKLCEKKKESFSKKAETIIDKALARLERELDDERKEIPVNHLTTVIGTMYDKKALADGKPTERTELVGGDKLNKLAELAGYERKQ